MNVVTKVFIIINLLLSLGAAFTVINQFAYNEHYRRRWIKDTDELANQLKNRDTAIVKQSYRATVAETALITANARIATQDNDLKQRSAELMQKESEIVQKNLDIHKRDETITAQRERISTLDKSLLLARQRVNELNQIAQVARSVAFQLNVKLAEVEDDYNNAQTELTRREEVIQRMEGDGKRKDALLALVRTRHPDVYREVTSGEPPAAQVIHAVVAAVRTDPNNRQDLVMLTVGKEEEVREGMEFIVYRGNQYVVKVRVERPMGDMAACRVIPESWNMRGEAIQKGDLAQNRLLF